MFTFQRQGPVLFVPIFFIVNATAARPLEGTVELATNESVEVEFR